MPLNDYLKMEEFFFMVLIKKISFYFRGMTFKWLLENPPGWLNKMALRRYVYLFEESKELVRMKREEKQKRTPGAFEY